jgi:hypothetical protein
MLPALIIASRNTSSEYSGNCFTKQYTYNLALHYVHLRITAKEHYTCIGGYHITIFGLNSTLHPK